ncbi:MAG: hypothetical protein LWW87_10470 [Geobacteraceae bacterium]|nr:hypothetical protein [Geobacteraceae bacterium]
MLSGSGNPTMENLSKILFALKESLRVEIRTSVVAGLLAKFPKLSPVCFATVEHVEDSAPRIMLHSNSPPWSIPKKQGHSFRKAPVHQALSK